MEYTRFVIVCFAISRQNRRSQVPTVGKKQRFDPLRSATRREASFPAIDTLPVREMSNWPRLLLSNWRVIRTWGNVLSSEWDRFIFFRPAFVPTRRESAWREEEQRGTRHRHTLRKTRIGRERLAITQISACTFCAGRQPQRETGGANIVEQISPNVNLLVGLKGGRWTLLCHCSHTHSSSNPACCLYLRLCDGVLFLGGVSDQSQHYLMRQSNPCCLCRMSDAPGQEKWRAALVLCFTLPLRFENTSLRVPTHKC